MTEINLKNGLYPWLNSYMESLVSLVEKNRLPHALLLSGLKGLGKFELSYFFAAYLLCESEDSVACGQCRSCELISANTHPDLFLIKNESEKEQIKVDQIRELGDFLNKTSQRDGYRIVIIDFANKMNVAASNSLLKNLEEPGKNTLIFLISQSAEALLPTIRSRCQLFPISAPNRELSLSWLEAGIGKGELAENLLKEANGSPLNALANFNSEIYQDRNKVIQALLALSEGNDNIVSIAQSLNDLPLSDLFEWWFQWMVDLMKVQASADEHFIRNSANLTQINSLAGLLSNAALAQFADQLSEALNLVNRGANLNSQLLLESLLDDWRKLSQ